MKKITLILSVLCILMLTVFVTGCGSSDSSDVENPYVEASQEQVEEAVGFSLDAPEGASDVVYAYIEGTDEQEATAQVEFTLEDNKYCYRGQMTSLLSLASNEDEDAETSDLQATVEEGLETAQAISGMNFDWEASGNTLVKEREAVFGINDGKEGVLAWIDVVPGVLYSLSMEDNASQEALEETADKIFVELQGDS